MSRVLAGVTGAAGATGATGATGLDQVDTGLTLIEGSSGVTLGIDPTSTIHVAGVSSDGGATLGSSLRVTTADSDGVAVEVPSGGRIRNTNGGPQVHIKSNQVQILPLNSASSGLHVTEDLVKSNKLVHTIEGISMDTSGITFPDGTHQSSASSGSISEITDSYVGHIEHVLNKTYFIDARLVAARTITEFFAFASTGGCTAELHGNGNSIGTIILNPDSQGVTGATTQSSLANTTIPVGSTLQFTVSGNTLAEDFRFAIGYTQ